MSVRTARFVEVARDVLLWTEVTGSGPNPPIILVMGANASGVTWPDALVDELAGSRRVVRFDHRDTGKSTKCFPDDPYPLTTLADDIIRVLDALDIERAHFVGMSMGGMLVQLVMLDHPERVAGATLFGVAPLGGCEIPDALGSLPEPAPELLELWSRFGEERTPSENLAFDVEHWRLLNNGGVAFDEAEFTELEMRIRTHGGDTGPNFAHAMASQHGLERGAELASVRIPTLVIDAPSDPVAQPPTAEVLAKVIPGARLVTVPGMGHALPAAVLPDLTNAIRLFVDDLEKADER
jgi:pimeloyl-ACP methyl ester carboxylesterase